jgi:putative redox protein
MIDCQTERPSEFRQVLQVRQKHELHADSGVAAGSADSAPDPHDYFDTALAACKTLTATWFARKNGIPLERVESHVERDNSKEREGVYSLKVRVKFHGPLSEEQRTKLYNAVARCPIHKLMTTTDVVIETAPLDAA